MSKPRTVQVHMGTGAVATRTHSQSAHFCCLTFLPRSEKLPLLLCPLESTLRLLFIKTKKDKEFGKERKGGNRAVGRGPIRTRHPIVLNASVEYFGTPSQPLPSF